MSSKTPRFVGSAKLPTVEAVGSLLCTSACLGAPALRVRCHGRRRAGQSAVVLEHDHLNQETEDYREDHAEDHREEERAVDQE